MKIEGRHTQASDLGVGVAVSAAVHVVIAALIVAVWVYDLFDDDGDEEEHEQESVVVMLEDEPQATAAEELEWVDEEAPEMVPEPLPQQEEQEEEQAPAEEEEPKEEEEEEPEEEEEEPDEDDDFPDEQHLDRYAVDQQTDDEEPDEADHISDEAHRTDEETVAETTTMEDVEPEEDPEALEQEADTDREMAMETPEEEAEIPDLVDPEDMDVADDAEMEAEEIDEESEIDEEPDEEDSQERDEEEAVAEQEAGRQYRDPSEIFVEDSEADDQARDEEFEREALFGRDQARADEVLGGDDSEKTKGSEERSQSGRQLLSNWRENEDAMRAALENFVPHVQPGNHTSVNAKAADHASFIARMHRSIHAEWAEGFIPRVSRNFSSRHELNDQDLKTTIEIVIDAEEEEVVDVVRVRPSGSDLFDGAALSIARNARDLSDPPDSIVSPDGNIYIHWRFWRNHKRCGTFGVRIFDVGNDAERRPVGEP